MNALDDSKKTVIAGPITIGDDDPVTKYQAESDGRTFWAYNGMEVFYEDERFYHALDKIWALEAENEKYKRILEHHKWVANQDKLLKP